MCMEEKYANPGMHLDTDDHGRLLRENRGAYARDEAERLSNEIRTLEDAINVGVAHDAQIRLREEIEAKQIKLNQLGEIIEHERP